VNSVFAPVALVASTRISTWAKPAQVDPVPLDFDELVDDSLDHTDWIQAGVVVLVAIVVAIIANRVARKIGERAIGQGFAALLIARAIGYVIVLVGVIYAIGGLGVRIGPLLGALGIGGLVLALALQGVVENFFGALILQSRRPFTIGDTVELGELQGVVKDIDSRTVVLRGLDGTWIRIPNSKVLSDPIVTLTTEALRRSRITVGVAYGSNLARATEVIVEALGRVARVCDGPPPFVGLRAFSSSTIDIDVFYWHASDVPAELAATHDVVLAIHQALADQGITIAFPQVVVWQGQDADEPVYSEPPGRVHTRHAGASSVLPHDEDPGASSWRRWRRGRGHSDR
jgi:small conductance mechanosensitive channel